MASIHEIIPEILDDNSGGVKFMDLLVTVLEKHNKEPIKEFLRVEDFKIAHFLMGMLKEMDGVHIQEYTWKSMNREKFFVYQK